RGGELGSLPVRVIVCAVLNATLTVCGLAVGELPVACVTAMGCPSTVRFPTRDGPVFAVKLKLITPALIVPAVSHAASLLGAKGARRFMALGSTAGSTSEPPAAGSLFGVASTNA